MFKPNLKEIIFSFLIFFYYQTVCSQPQIEKLDWYFVNGNANELILLSDIDDPIKDGSCHKLMSELTTGSKGLWSRYYFNDSKIQGQWYKDFSFFKVTTPQHAELTQRSLYDTSNLMYVEYPQLSNEKQYLHLTPERPESKNYHFYFEYTFDPYLFLQIYKSTNNSGYCHTIVENNTTYLHFKHAEDPRTLNCVHVYKFTNTDFINEDIPDFSVNKEANYLFLQRNYKLGYTYNTVIFPVDVPLYDYSHAYNNGKDVMNVYKLQSIDDNSLNFIKDVSGVLKANTPYIIRSQKDDQTSKEDVLSSYYLSENPVDTFDINCVKNVLSSDNTNVYAQYKQSVNFDYGKSNKEDIQDEVYIVSNNKLVNCKNVASANIKRFRWFITRPASLAATPMTITFDGTTDIVAIEQEHIKDNAIYDLSGRKCSNNISKNQLQKGCYIVNGKVRILGK